MPYQKTKDGSLVNEVTLGDGYPLSNDLQPLKIGGEASPIEMSTSLPDGSDSGKVKVRGDLEVTGGLNFKNDVEVDLSFDDLSLSGDLDVAGNVGIGTTSPANKLQVSHTAADGDNGLMIVREDTSTADGDLLGAIGFDSTDGNVPSSVLESSAFIAAYAAETQGTTDKGADLVFGATLKNDDDDTVSHEYMRITDNGDIGIGTASVIAALTVKSNSTSSGNSGFTLMDNSDTNPIVQIGEKSTDGGRLHMYDGGTLKISLYTDGTDNFINSGKLGIGIDSPTTTLDVEGTVSYKHTAFTTAGPTDNVDVSDTTVLEVDTSSNNVTIGGFTGGVQGQILYIVKTNTANFIQLEHNEGG